MKQSKTLSKIPTDISLIETPFGELMLVADSSALIGLYFKGCKHAPQAPEEWIKPAKHPVLQQTARELQEYFARKRKTFSIPLRLTGSDFQERVWREIRLIPYGQTISYTDLALRVKAPNAIRAVGANTGRNPISIIIPCHRVVGKAGNLCGFAGGLARKKYLLELESEVIPFAVREPRE